MDKSDIYLHWEDMAQKHGADCSATIPDYYLKVLELESIYKHLNDDIKILDAGCGNGYSSFQIKKRFRCDITAVDFSEEMIKAAMSEQSRLGIIDGLRFDIQDVLNLKEPDEWYDAVITERSIINLRSWDDQKRAIREVWRVLKPKGLYIMAEAFEEPLANLNEIRTNLGLSPIKTKWHNIYLSEEKVCEYVQDMFCVLTIDNYSSTYYLLTRAVSPKIGEIEGRSTTYTDPMNQVAAQLPKIGDFGPQKTIVLQKRLVA